MSARKAALPYIAIILATLGSLTGFFLLKNVDVGCSYSRDVHAVDSSQVHELSADECKSIKYGIEENGLVHADGSDEPDVLGVYRVRGWCLEKASGEYHAAAVSVLLKSSDKLYEVALHTEKNPDYANDYTKYFKYYSGQDASQEAGFFCCIPKDAVSTGTYQIGIRVKSGTGTPVLWTDSYVDLDESD